jgi:hypothetical protein
MTDKKDELGRSFSTICGWLGGNPPPVGARVKLLAGSMPLFHDLAIGLEVVVLRHMPPKHRLDRFELKCRYVVPQSQWDTANHCVAYAERVELVHPGDGTVLPGRDYEFTQLELAQARFNAMDHTYQGYTNAATFLAALYLRADAPHHNAVLGMVKANGRINPQRLENYFRRSKLVIDEWAQYAQGLPKRIEFCLCVNWQEVATEFEELAQEQAH